MTLTIWMISRVFGGVLGLMILHALDEGMLDEALLKGAMIPPPTPEGRFKFLVLCTILPELVIVGLLISWRLWRKDRR
jgi:hypothetical protein